MIDPCFRATRQVRVAKLIQWTSRWFGRGVRVGVAAGKAFFDQHVVHVGSFTDHVAEKSAVFSTLSAHHLDLGTIGTKFTHSLGGCLAAGENLLDTHSPLMGLLFAPAPRIIIESGLGCVDADHADHDFFLGLSAQDGGGISILPEFYRAVLRGLIFLHLLKAWNFTVTRGGTRACEAHCHGQ